MQLNALERLIDVLVKNTCFSQFGFGDFFMTTNLGLFLKFCFAAI